MDLAKSIVAAFGLIGFIVCAIAGIGSLFHPGAVVNVLLCLVLGGACYLAVDWATKE